MPPLGLVSEKRWYKGMGEYRGSRDKHFDVQTGFRHDGNIRRMDVMCNSFNALAVKRTVMLEMFFDDNYALGMWRTVKTRQGKLGF